MPPPVEAADACTASRAQIALYYLGRARRRLIDAKPYLDGTDSGRNFDGLLSALESRIDRIRLHGLGPIESATIVHLGEPIAVPVGADSPFVWIKTELGFRSGCGRYAIRAHDGGYRALCFANAAEDVPHHITTVFPDAARAMAWCEIDEVLSSDRPCEDADALVFVEGYPTVPEQ